MLILNLHCLAFSCSELFPDSSDYFILILIMYFFVLFDLGNLWSQGILAVVYQMLDVNEMDSNLNFFFKLSWPAFPLETV